MIPASAIVHNKSTGKVGVGGMDMAYCAAGIKKVKILRFRVVGSSGTLSAGSATRRMHGSVLPGGSFPGSPVVVPWESRPQSAESTSRAVGQRIPG